MSAISVEMVANEGCSNSATMLSIDEVLGHVLSASLSLPPSLNERLGVVMGGVTPRTVADSGGPGTSSPVTLSIDSVSVLWKPLKRQKCPCESVCPCLVGSKVAHPASSP